MSPKSLLDSECNNNVVGKKQIGTVVGTSHTFGNKRDPKSVLRGAHPGEKG